MINTYKKGFVYLLGDTSNDGIYKIGVTRGDIGKRIKKLQTGNSGEIFLCDYFDTDYPFFIESRLHTLFSDKNVLNEWYELTLEERKNFKEICKKEEKMVDALKDNPFFKKYMK